MKIYICVLKSDSEVATKAELEQFRNQLLDTYSLYLETGIPAIKEEVVEKAYELHLRDPNFSFII